MTGTLLSRRGLSRSNTHTEDEDVEEPPNKTEWESAMACLRVLELYSGIGGMHCALKGKLVIDKVRNKLQTLFTKTRVRPFDRYSSFTRISICTSVMLGTMTSPRLVLFVKLYY